MIKVEKFIFNYCCYIRQTDPSLLKATLSHALAESEYEVLNFMEHHFKPFGYTAVWLLAESHFSLHTFPEFEQTYLQICGCNEEKNNRLIQILHRLNQEGILIQVEGSGQRF